MINLENAVFSINFEDDKTPLLQIKKGGALVNNLKNNINQQNELKFYIEDLLTLLKASTQFQTQLKNEKVNYVELFDKYLGDLIKPYLRDIANIFCERNKGKYYNKEKDINKAMEYIYKFLSKRLDS